MRYKVTSIIAKPPTCQSVLLEANYCLAWLDNYRRHSRSYEHHINTAKHMVVIAFVMILLRAVHVV